MNIKLLSSIVGGLVGYCVWLVLLESEKMTGVIFRQNDAGEKIFTPQNILLYMIAPFQHSFFWSPYFFQHNWIVMTTFGIIYGLCLPIGVQLLK